MFKCFLNIKIIFNTLRKKSLRSNTYTYEKNKIIEFFLLSPKFFTSAKFEYKRTGEYEYVLEKNCQAWNEIFTFLFG